MDWCSVFLMAANRDIPGKKLWEGLFIESTRLCSPDASGECLRWSTPE